MTDTIKTNTGANLVTPPTGITETEPEFTYAGIVAAVGAAIVLGKAFGLPISEEQENALLSFLTIVLPLFTAFLIRRKVYSPSSAQMQANQAAETRDATLTPPPAK